MAQPAPGLTIRKHRVEDHRPRIAGYDPLSGEKTLINPLTYEPMPYELAGVDIEGELPERFTVPTKLLATWRAEGWVTVDPPEGRPAHRPGGPPEDPWRVAHTFIHYDQATFNFLSGPVTARVIHQPDKYADYSQASLPDRIEPFEADDDTPVDPDLYAAGATRIDWVYVFDVVSTVKGARESGTAAGTGKEG